MRILLAHNRFPVYGGAEVFYHEIARILAEKGHEVAQFSRLENGIESEWSSYFPPIDDYRTRNPLKRIKIIGKAIYNRTAKRAFAQLIRDFRPDVIHVFAVYVSLTPAILDAARQADVPVVMSCNDYKHICPNYKLYHHGKICEDCKGGRFYSAVLNRCYHESVAFSLAACIESYVHKWMNIYRRNVDVFLFASDFMARKTEEFWDSGSFSWRKLKNPFDVPSSILEGPVGDYVLYFGRLIDEKGVDILLSAACKVPEIPIVVIGEGPDQNKVQHLANEQTNVRFLGPKWGAALNEWLRNAKIVVVPSIWHENFPYVILQSFAAGKPVVGSNRGGIPELVAGPKQGWLYEATSPEELASVLKEAYETDDAILERMGKELRSFVSREFSDEMVYKELINIYREVMK